MAKLCLIYFDLNTGYYPSFHHGLAYIIGTLKNENHDVTLFHLVNEKDLDTIVRKLEKDDPDLVGLSFATNQKKYVRRFFQMTNLPSKLVIAGGVHCTLERENIFTKFPRVDGICIGEGEIPIKELCRKIDNNEDYLSSPSFYFKNKEQIVKNPISPLQEIDDLALPDYTLFNHNEIISENGDSFPMMLGRGCPYSCHYCCNHVLRQVYPNKNKYVRFPSIKHSMNIISNNLSIYPNAKKIAFADDTFTLNVNWLTEFCERYKKVVGLPFICNGRVETISERVVKNLKIAGCISIDFGVESGNEWLRKYILNRKHSNKCIQEAFNLTKKQGISAFSFNIVGLPFETNEMAKDTLELNLKLRPNFGKCFYFYPYPGTFLSRLCMKYDLLLNEIDSISGYLERPSLKELFMTHKETRKHFELLNVFFYFQLLLHRTSMPLIFEKYLLKIVFVLQQPISRLLDQRGNNRKLIAVRGVLRKWAKTYLR